MKKYFALIACILFTCSIYAQEKYPVPVRTPEQKHIRTLSQLWIIIAGGINFAKTHGVSPYEYGKYLGTQFAPSWGAGNDFDVFVKGTLFNLENFRDESDAALKVTENGDGSVSIITGESMIHRYIPDGNPFTGFSEMVEFMKGLNEPIADYMGATVRIDLKDNMMIYTYRKKQATP